MAGPGRPSAQFPWHGGVATSALHSAPKPGTEKGPGPPPVSLTVLRRPKLHPTPPWPASGGWHGLSATGRPHRGPTQAPGRPCSPHGFLRCSLLRVWLPYWPLWSSKGWGGQALLSELSRKYLLVKAPGGPLHLPSHKLHFCTSGGQVGAPFPAPCKSRSVENGKQQRPPPHPCPNPGRGRVDTGPPLVVPVCFCATWASTGGQVSMHTRACALRGGLTDGRVPRG